MHKADWQAIAEEYITGEISMRSLAIRHDLPRSTLRSRAYREGWIERREAFQRAAAQAEDGTSSDPAAEETPLSPERAVYESEIFRVTDKLVRRAEEILDGPEAVGARELGELMRAIKNAKEIRMLRSELDEREQRARLRTLEEKSAAADRTLRIEFAPEAEEAAT